MSIQTDYKDLNNTLNNELENMKLLFNEQNKTMDSLESEYKKYKNVNKVSNIAL